jgi:hypothetical protein
LAVPSLERMPCDHPDAATFAGDGVNSVIRDARRSPRVAHQAGGVVRRPVGRYRLDARESLDTEGSVTRTPATLGSAALTARVGSCSA